MAPMVRPFPYKSRRQGQCQCQPCLRPPPVGPCMEDSDAATRRFRLWLRGLRSLRGDLRSARWSDDPAQLSALVGRFVAHVESYCAGRAELDPVLALSAPWASAAERGAAYWLAGWRPTTLVHLLYTESGRRLEAQLPDLLLGVRSGNLGDLSPAQLARVDDLHRRTVAEEDALSREMAQVQEGHAVLAAATTAGAGLDLDVDALVARVGAVLRGADALRLRTVKRAVEILQPAQAAELLIAAADLEIGFREFGLKYGSARDG
ncbi:hypothetical protein BS78_06G152100 [Paspalum vaginatum]|nr:hypothetical protein BS78_06G152100 [Paspalum vaginatum]